MSEAGSPPVIEEPSSRPNERSATDLFRGLIGICLVAGGWVLARAPGGLDDDLAGALTRMLDVLPVGLDALIVRGTTALVAIAVAVAIVQGVLRTSARFLGAIVVGSAIAGAVTGWLTQGGVVLSVAIVVAASASVWVGRSTSRWLWACLALASVVWMADGNGSGGALMVALGSGVLGASVSGVILGRPNRRPRGADVAAAFGEAGLPLAALRTAAVDARGSTPYFGTTTEGTGVFVKVLAEDERSSDLLFRVYRYVALRDSGDLRPFSSLRRAVEHEALVSLWASARGIRTPPVAALAELDDGGIALAYQRVEGRSLDGVPPGDISDDMLREAWELVASLRANGIAHRDLRLANVFVPDDGPMMLIDFGFSEMAASPTQRRGDVAELLLSTAAVVGPERAVAACAEVLGAEALADAAPRVQLAGVSSATRGAVRARAGSLESVQAEIRLRTGVEEVRLERLQRFRAATLLLGLSLVFALFLAAPLMSGLREIWATFDHFRWAPVLAATALSALVYLPAATALRACLPEPPPLGPTTWVQLAGSFINHVIPARLGGMATNVRFLRRRGATGVEATGAVGAQQAGGLVVHVVLLGFFGVFVTGSVSGFREERMFAADARLFIGLALALSVVAILTALVPWTRRKIWTHAMPAARAAGATLRGLTRGQLARLAGSGVVLNLLMIVVLALCARSFDLDLPFVSIAFAYLAGMAAAALAPTPGGLVAIEAALTAALVGVGLDVEEALATTLLFRVVTFWLPVVPGWLALVALERRGEL